MGIIIMRDKIQIKKLWKIKKVHISNGRGVIHVLDWDYTLHNSILCLLHYDTVHSVTNTLHNSVLFVTNTLCITVDAACHKHITLQCNLLSQVHNIIVHTFCKKT